MKPSQPKVPVPAAKGASYPPAKQAKLAKKLPVVDLKSSIARRLAK